MSSNTFTRYQCDWCGAEVEVTHASGMVAFPERPREWARIQLEDDPNDLCSYCAEALRALAVSRGASFATHALESEYAPG